MEVIKQIQDKYNTENNFSFERFPFSFDEFLSELEIVLCLILRLTKEKNLIHLLYPLLKRKVITQYIWDDDHDSEETKLMYFTDFVISELKENAENYERSVYSEKAYFSLRTQTNNWENFIHMSEIFDTPTNAVLHLLGIVYNTSETSRLLYPIIKKLKDIMLSYDTKRITSTI